MNKNNDIQPGLEQETEYDRMLWIYNDFIEKLDSIDGATQLRMVIHDDALAIAEDPLVSKFLSSLDCCVDPDWYLQDYPVVREDMGSGVEVHDRLLARHIVDGEIRATVYSAITIHGESATELVCVISGRPKFEQIESAS